MRRASLSSGQKFLCVFNQLLALFFLLKTRRQNKRQLLGEDSLLFQDYGHWRGYLIFIRGPDAHQQIQYVCRASQGLTSLKERNRINSKSVLCGVCMFPRLQSDYFPCFKKKKYWRCFPETK